MRQLFGIILAFSCSLCAGISAQSGTTNPDQLRYVERFSEIAMREMERAGVPASIKLAQGLLESDAGRSILARNGNNHFGIKCGSNWNGETIYRKDDDFNDQGQLIKSCFRGYRNAEASFVAHSEFLRDSRKAFRYGFLFRLDPLDYRSWAEGLRRAGYATNPRYPEILISLIERYKLYQYDQPRAIDVNDPIDIETPAAELVAGILRTNDVTYFVSDEALTVEDVARRVDVSVRRLIDYNEQLANDNQQVVPGQRVFIQKKRNNYRGQEKFHTVLAGESLQEISDRYGVRMDKLLKRNRLTSPQQRVAPGEKIKLRGGKVSTAPRIGGAPAPTTPDRPNVPTTDNGNLDLDTEDPIPPPVRPGTDGGRPTVPVPAPPPPLPSNGQPDFGDEPEVTNPGTPPVPTTDRPAPTPPPVTPPPTPNPTVDPTPPTSPPPTVTPGPTTPPPAATRAHTVVKGDTLYNISRRYGLSVDQLKALNNLTTNLISIGQELRVQ